MAICNTGNQVLDPYQSIMNGLNKTAFGLENAAAFIQPTIDAFDAISDSILTPTLPSALTLALNQFTAEAICASKTDLEPINQLTADCLYEAAAAVKRFLKDILSNIGDGILLINDLITLPEGILFTYFQQIWGLTTDIKDLVTAVNWRIECVALKTPDYEDQILGIETRVSDVLDRLRLDTDGSFSAPVFCKNLTAPLKANMETYESHANNLIKEINANVSDTIDLSANVVPKGYF
jgi:hypothetical protein